MTYEILTKPVLNAVEKIHPNGTREITGHSWTTVNIKGNATVGSTIDKIETDDIDLYGVRVTKKLSEDTFECTIVGADIKRL
jgi:hypothetical protein